MATPEITVRRRVVKRRPQRQAEPTRPAGAHIPRISRLMAFAIVADEMVRKGEIRDYAELARIGQVSRARVTQIMDLLNLAPGIQEALLGLRLTDGADPLTERQLRPIAAASDWTEQLGLWENLRP